MTKKLKFVVHFTSDVNDNNVIYAKYIEGENEKIAIKRFEKAVPINVHILCITKL